LFFGSLLLLVGCASIPQLKEGEAFRAPAAPNYALEENWAALPFRDDGADRTPGDDLEDGQLTARADVFYLHPTIYADTRKGNERWNANLGDDKLNASVDELTLPNHAAIFNAAAKVYAPRYRQAHIKVFYKAGNSVAEQALDTAYQDVLAAFDFYLENYNRGRPIIIASHSQGTTHAKRLLADRFDGKPLKKQLVAAYLVGMPVSKKAYRTIPVCEAPTETGCFVSWRTYRDDFKPDPKYQDTVPNIAVVNPISWTTTGARAPAEQNLGGVLYNYEAGPLPNLVWAEIRGAGLFTNKPKFFGDILFSTKNYHVGDYNLFWMNIRKNAVDRVEAFLSDGAGGPLVTE
jgi:hypothetical protein